MTALLIAAALARTSSAQSNDWQSLVTTQSRVEKAWFRWRSEWRGYLPKLSADDIARAMASAETQLKSQGYVGENLERELKQFETLYTTQPINVTTKICRTDQKVVSEETLAGPDSAAPKSWLEDEQKATASYSDGTHSTSFAPGSLGEFKKNDSNPYRLNGGTSLDPFVLCLFHLNNTFGEKDIVSSGGGLLTLKKSISTGEPKMYVVSVNVSTGVPTVLDITDPYGNLQMRYSVVATATIDGFQVPTRVAFEVFNGHRGPAHNTTTYTLLEAHINNSGVDTRHLSTLGRTSNGVLDERFGGSHPKLRTLGSVIPSDDDVAKLPDTADVPRWRKGPSWLFAIPFALIAAGIILLGLKRRRPAKPSA